MIDCSKIILRPFRAFGMDQTEGMVTDIIPLKAGKFAAEHLKSGAIHI